ncbi:Sodium-dependent neutral amino acid transporter B(0)AT1 [Portunus trituberculatus]|uniref:Sodium-dependent neutral amino acid transporter B(0)AT1 n=1 Tax=Portunus trituberculatus TaxID=210409 RepID=A0A5B7H222_PORTR|nr:Sodium-dependent neutral amino acid transporter B(0)AT1 [Portunus trituberculatus]
MLAVEGIPVFYLELAVGQRLRKGAIGVWNQVSPYCGGIGVASAFVSFNVALYYNTIIAWCLYYLAGTITLFSFNLSRPYNLFPSILLRPLHPSLPSFPLSHISPLILLFRPFSAFTAPSTYLNIQFRPFPSSTSHSIVLFHHSQPRKTRSIPQLYPSAQKPLPVHSIT